MYTLLTRWKKKKSFIFIYLSPDLIFLFLLFIYIQFEFRTILFFIQFPRTRRPKGKLSRGCEYNLLTKFFVHLLRLIFPRISYNFILCLEREIIHSSLIQPCSTKFNPLNLDITLRFSKFIISHWEKNLSTRHYLPKRHAGVFEPSPGAKRRIARGRGGGEALYHPKAIWERYFKFTSYPSGMFYKEIPVGPDSFPGGRKGRMRAVRLLPSSRAELRLRGKNRDDFRRKNPPENRN